MRACSRLAAGQERARSCPPDAVAVKPAFLCVVQPSGRRLFKHIAAAVLDSMVTLSSLVGHGLPGPFQLAVSCSDAPRFAKLRHALHSLAGHGP